MGALHSIRRYERLLARYLRPEWPRLLLLALLLAVAIAVQVLTPLLASRFVDRAGRGALMRELVGLSLLTIALALLGQVAAVVETYVAENVSWAATNSLRVDLLAHLLRLDAGFHSAHTPGELIERVDGDVGTLARFFSRFAVYVLGNGVLILAVLGLLFAVDWRIGLAIGVFLLLALGAMLAVRAAATPAWVAERQRSAEFYGLLGEYLGGLEDIRGNGASDFVLLGAARSMRAWLAATIRAGMWGYALFAISSGLFGLGPVIAFALSAALYKSGALSLGAVYLVFQYSVILKQPADRIRTEVQGLQQADAGMGRIEALLAVRPRLADGPRAALPPGRLSVELEQVSFGYAPDAPVLRDVSLRLEPGRVLGVVGRTGSGKTSLTRLLLRFYDPQAGVVRLGGVDLRQVKLSAVRERVGLVTQDVRLFDAGVRDNLTLFDDAVPEQRIVAVLEGLGLGDWLCSLPHGLATRLGPGGINLSAGQAQLLACARVFLADPDLVILDEASSRLDPATERLVQSAIRRLLEGRTGIIVAHRLSTLSEVDDVLVLEDGAVREYGPRDLLAADSGSRFAGLLRLATEEEGEEVLP